MLLLEVLHERVHNVPVAVALLERALLPEAVAVTARHRRIRPHPRRAATGGGVRGTPHGRATHGRATHASATAAAAVPHALEELVWGVGWGWGEGGGVRGGGGGYGWRYGWR